MLRSLLGLFLMGISFPKMWLTERKWPEATPPEKKVQQPNRSLTHNVKDDLTDDVQWGDREWHLKFLGFWFVIFIALSVVLLLLLLAVLLKD